MEPFRVYGKTELGATALTSARGSLASSARQLLILVDGERSVGELGGIFGAESVDQLLPQLERQGYVQFLRDAEGGGTQTRFVPPASAAAQTPLPPAAAAPAAPRNRLAIAVLAFGVLSASAAIWWFLGPARNPAPVATVAAEAPPPAVAAPPADATAPAPAPSPVPPATEDPPSPETRRIEPVRTDSRPPASPVAAAPARAEPSTSPAPSASSKTSVATAALPASRDAAPAAARAPAPAPAATSAPAPVAPPPVAKTVTVTAPPPVRTVVATETPPNPAPTAAAVAPDASRAVAAGARGAAAVRPAAPAANPAVVPVLHPRERTMPELSRRARRAGIDSGELVVRLHISDRGTVEAVDVVKASPPQVYDSDVQQTLLNWTFDPPGVPVITKVEFSFKP